MGCVGLVPVEITFFFFLFFFFSHLPPRRIIQCVVQGFVRIFIVSFDLGEPQMPVVLLKHKNKGLNK